MQPELTFAVFLQDPQLCRRHRCEFHAVFFKSTEHRHIQNRRTVVDCPFPAFRRGIKLREICSNSDFAEEKNNGQRQPRFFLERILPDRLNVGQLA